MQIHLPLHLQHRNGRRLLEVSVTFDALLNKIWDKGGKNIDANKYNLLDLLPKYLRSKILFFVDYTGQNQICCLFILADLWWIWWAESKNHIGFA